MFKGNTHYAVLPDRFESDIDYMVKCFADFCGYPPTKRDIKRLVKPKIGYWQFEIAGDIWNFEDILFILRYNAEIRPKWLTDWQKYDKSGECNENHFYIDLFHWMDIASQLWDKYSPNAVVKHIYWTTTTYALLETRKKWRELMNTLQGRFVFRVNNGIKRVKKICVFIAKQYNKITKLFSKK